MKLGFIGCGNIAEAIISGILAGGLLQAQNILAADADGKKLQVMVKNLGIKGAETNEAVIKECDVVIIAVKPHIYSIALPPLQAVIGKAKPLLVSVAAGMALSNVRDYLGGIDIPIIRVMPNVNSAVGEGMTALCANTFVTEGQMAQALSIFNAIGKATVLEEKLFGVFAGIAGCSPAFVYMFIEALAKAALKNGIPKEQALEIAAQAVLGSAKMLLEKGKHPGELVDSVTSPGGTTIAGVCTLEHEGFSSAVIKAVEATISRDNEIKALNQAN